MKNYILYILIIALFALSHCNCEHCVDNISVINKKIPYTDSTIVYFKNDTLGVVADTVFVKLGKVSTKPYRCNGGRDSDSELCWARSYIFYSYNFCTLEIFQFPNVYDNKIGIGFPYDYTEHIIFDSISYFFNNKEYNARRVCFKTDSSNSFLWQRNFMRDSTVSFDNYIYSIDPEIKLLQYTTVYKDGTRRIWRLKE